MTQDEIDDSTLRAVADAVVAWHLMESSVQSKAMAGLLAASTGPFRMQR